jgi:RES domain-containing protein
MRLYRLCRTKYARDLSGAGAEKTGGRWNKRGTPVIYASSSRALCVAEMAVHLPLGILPADYTMITYEIPESVPVGMPDERKLPGNWNSIPHGEETQDLGEQFVAEMKFALLKVPSASVEGEFNYLINPRHPKAKFVRIAELKPFTFDSRLFVRGFAESD